jgi:site-specific DNA-cytosine methylase
MIALDCQTFGGAFSLGVARAGFKIIGKREGAAGFGVPMYRDNTDLLGVDPSTIQTDIPAAWETADVDLIFGNPACSGFSQYSGFIHNNENFRGIDSPANQGMWDLINLAGSCDPQIVVFESVVLAYSKGRDLMKMLREKLEFESGQKYTLHHILHNNSALGGYAERKRYFFVASRVPFGIEHPTLDKTLTLRDCIGDLESFFDADIGHVILDSPRARRLAELASKVEWNADEFSGVPYQRSQKLGVVLQTWIESKPGHDVRSSQFSAIRWNYDRPARVLTQHALRGCVHPTQPRTFTYREVARIMGLPDNWSLTSTMKHRSSGQFWFGKGIPVQSGEWIARWSAASLNGQPGPITGTMIGDREYLIDVRKPKLSMYANMDRLFDE